MKKILSIALALTLAAACSKSGDEALSPERGGGEILLSSRIESQSKAAQGLDEALAEEEQVHIWIDKHEDDSPLYENNVLTVGEEGILSGGQKMYYPDNDEAINIYALHTNASNPAFEKKLEHTVAKDQTSGEDGNMAGSDLTFARLEEAYEPRKGEAQTLQFEHLLSKIEIILLLSDQAKEAGAQVSELYFSGVENTASFTLYKDGYMTMRTLGSAQDIKMDADVTTDVNAPILNEAIVVPQAIAAGTNIIYVKVNGEFYSFATPQASGFDSGKKYTYTVTIHTQNELEVTSSVSDWEYDAIDDIFEEAESEDPPYMIFSAEDLKMIGAEGGYPLNGEYLLMDDIDLQGEEWTPIGKFRSEFTGTFDGGGHSISGLNINFNETTSGYLGLFGCAKDATIENLTIINPQIQAEGSADNRVGAIVGAADRTTIKNCEVLGDEDASDVYIKLLDNYGSVGAIAGYTYDSHIIGCHNSCAITGSGSENRVGGIVGSSSSSSIVACSNSATIEITQSNSQVGGIAGHVFISEIHGCFSVGQIENEDGSSDAGAIAGVNHKGTIAGCYYLAGKGADTGVGIENGGTSTTTPVDDIEELNEEGVIRAMNYSVYSYSKDNGLYEGDKLAFGFKAGSPAVSAIPSIEKDVDFTPPAGELKAGYTAIFSVEQLRSIATKQTLGVKYQLMNDLDLGGKEDNQWTPIGSSDRGQEFRGTFDGGGHSISGLYINYSSDTESGYLGLFGRARGVTIENIKIIDPQIQAESSWNNYAGAIVGYALDTTIKNCEVLDDEDASSEAYIKVLDEYGSVGAIAGYTYDSHIIGCHNSCAITGSGRENKVGGIVGIIYTSSIVACSNSGAIEITQSGSYVGGIAGIASDAGEIHGCFSVGEIVKPEGSSYAGAIAGENNGFIEGCYYLEEKGADKGVGNTTQYSTSNTHDVADLAALNNDAAGEPIAAMNAAIHSFATDADNSDAAWIYDSVNGKLLFGFKVNGTAGSENAPLIAAGVKYPL